MNTLNFYPYYERFLRSRTKTTTFRTRAPAFRPGDIVQLTLGWSEEDVRKLHKAEILSVYSKTISSLESEDFEGESPDCKTPETTALVLSAIYRKQIEQGDSIWIVKFRHL